MKSKVWRPPRWPKKKKTFTQSTKQRSARLKFVKKCKSLTAERGRDDYLFFGSMPKIFILNYIVFIFIIIMLFWGVEVAPAYHEVIKKLKMNHLWLYTLHDISHSMPQRLQNVIKNKWGMPVTAVLNTCTRKGNKHLLEISCKNKVFIKSFSLWN